jgi:hypothetical protein
MKRFLQHMRKYPRSYGLMAVLWIIFNTIVYLLDTNPAKASRPSFTRMNALPLILLIFLSTRRNPHDIWI